MSTISLRPPEKGAVSSAAAPGPLAPLRHPVFAALWVATVASNTGTWMNDVGAAWLMTTLAPGPIMVALVQAATTLPVFLFALPAGALADILDRRRLLLSVNLVLAVVAASMTALVAGGMMTAPLLLLFTFLLGAGAAFMAPAWQAIVPGLVPRPALSAAVSLNSVGINVSRAFGPALAGLLIVSIGLWAPFAVNAFSFVGIIAVLWFWQGEPPRHRTTSPESVLGAMLAGLRYARNSVGLRRVILRALAFFTFASAYWALLPLIARDVLSGGAELYGLLLGAVGAGAVIGALALAWLRRQLEPGSLVLVGTLGTAIAMAAMAGFAVETVAIVVGLIAGASWITVLSSLQVAAQAALPNWVRARGLSLYLMAFFGAMSGGAVFWGLVAEEIGVAATLLVAAMTLAVVGFAATRIQIVAGDELATVASLHWPAPPIVESGAAADGPVLVTLDYHVAEVNITPFRALMAQLGAARRRDGGYGWHLFRIVEEDGLYREAFMVASWAEHLRQHERVTEAERRLQAEIIALIEGERPRVRHHLAL
ncbi:MAG: MFS transporter [Pseudomonadota bacterium]